MSNLSFNTLRWANAERLPTFRNAKGELSHSEPDGSDWSKAQWLQAVVGELGEYANLQKKVERGDITEEEAAPMLAAELADVATYLDILAMQHGFDLGQAITDKFNIVSKRVKTHIFLREDGACIVSR